MHAFAVLFVCMGNRCRSPTAQAVFGQRLAQAGLAKQVRIDSAGTHAAPRMLVDARSRDRARLRGYRLEGMRSRALQESDFSQFDMLLAMDEANLLHLHCHCAEVQWPRLHLMASFCTRHPGLRAVPDPYYGNTEGFDRVLNLLEDACDGLLLHVQQQLLIAARQ